jgi:hypothetical protein
MARAIDFFLDVPSSTGPIITFCRTVFHGKSASPWNI